MVAKGTLNIWQGFKRNDCLCNTFERFFLPLVRITEQVKIV
jgi:hypothetical protein